MDYVHKNAQRGFFSTYYWLEIRTRCRGSLGFCPAPVELHIRLAMRQFEQGESLSQRI